MCSPIFSSRIAADRVHAAWFGGQKGAAVYGWQEDVFEEIFQHAKCVKLIQFSGGEPFIHRTFREILRKLVETRDAAHIELYIASNGMTHSGELSSLLAHFSSVEVGISVDGLGALQEYIRFPSKWNALKRNLSSFQKDKVPISIRPTAQAYNAFGQAEVYDKLLGSQWDNLLQGSATAGADHPFASVRTREIIKWFKSEHF